MIRGPRVLARLVQRWGVMYTVFARNSSFSVSFTIITDAIAYAQASRTPCDVHRPSGAVAWVWEQR